ncbi:zinc finger MYM-type protein 3 [Euwallacea similis]|uniref:zinc finger MYM-type protein 3 n=1 Tax=Euwallacea similis TaxID=1736056 RepID=UPI00344B466A
MEVDGIEVALEKANSNAPISHDPIETDLVSKNLSNLKDKDCDNVPNNISSSVSLEIHSNEVSNDSLQHSQAPNGEREVFDYDSLERQEVDKPNISLQSHLVSNINVIENQNNENLERDSELMEFETVEPSAESVVLIKPENDDEHLPSGPLEVNCAMPSDRPIVCDDSEPMEVVDVSGDSLRQDEVKLGINEIEDGHDNTDPISSNADLASEGSKDLETTLKENEENIDSKDDKPNSAISFVSSEALADDSKLSDKVPIAEITQEPSIIDVDVPTSPIPDSPEKCINLPVEQVEEHDVATEELEVPTEEVDPINVVPVDSEPADDEEKEIRSELLENQKDTELGDDEGCDTDTLKDDTVEEHIADDLPEPLVNSLTGERSDEESQACTITDVSMGSTQEGNDVEEAELRNDDDQLPSTSTRDMDTDAPDEPPLLEVIDSIDNSQGADEEVTIIPDSEREITEAEKEAASSLPTLKDLSDKSVSIETVTPETETTNDELKIYKYDKDTECECCQCKETKLVKYHFSSGEQNVTYICDDACLKLYKESTARKITMITDEGSGLRVKNFAEGEPKEAPPLAFLRKCASCSKITDDIENNLTWEIMDFCNEICLSKYQKMVGSKCASCSGDVKSTSLGKYCVRFGNDIRQFCTSSCLEQYKKGLKVCSYCQQDMSKGHDGFLAPVGEKGQFKDFCSKLCMEKYDIMTNDKPPRVTSGTTCSVCKADNAITIEFEHDDNLNYFCGEPCFVAFVFVNKISPGKCAMCRRNFSKSILEQHTMFYDNVQHSFCSNSCKNIYIIAHRKIVPCSWCKVKKYNFDMIKKYSKTVPVINMCSINCLNLYQLSVNAVNAKPSPCNYCKKRSNPSYHLTMSDSSMRNFCSYTCVLDFQNQFSKQLTLNNLGEPIPMGSPLKTKRLSSTKESSSSSEGIGQLPIISSVKSLAKPNGTTPPLLPPGLSPLTTTRLTRSKVTPSTSTQQSSIQSVQNLDLPVQVQVKQQYIVQEKSCPEQRNVAILCQPKRTAKATQVTPTTRDACIQTDMEDIMKIVVPIPVPMYVPTPCHMFSTPVPIPVPFPLPIPIPIFIPTTRNSAAGIMKEIKKIQVKIPTDPYEAELLMMAEMVAGEKKEDHTDSESDLDDNTAEGGGEYSPEAVDSSNTFGDDMLQMALKMATELDEPAVDLEGALTANTITAPQGGHPPDVHPQEENVDDPQPMHPHLMERASIRGRKRGIRGSPRGGPAKRGRRMSHQHVDMPMMQPVQPSAPQEPQEKPDANMCLKYTFGVNAWKQWVTTKNAELEKSTRRMKLFKTEILQLTADELNYSLCLFVKEVRKPNGQEYAPDTIYYLCLGIQQYLFENGRIDNIFCDPYYEKFTDCLDEVAKKFSVLYNDSHYIVTRVEEEHLWESKQLGAHSPHVLLSTLMFFNTKHFNLTTVDEHMQLSFSHIMKHWKRNPNQPGASKVPGSRNVLLRFYPPQSALQNNQRKKKVYEQQENEENPLRCPVKLYEFYLSKCPESVKTRNDVFYLQPERSCVPDSPVWYSTMPLPREALEKMLHRVKMVKEINVALLTS